MTDANASLQSHLGNLDPSMAAVLGHILSNTGSLDKRMEAVDKRMEAVEASQVSMKNELQSQIDTLAAAVKNSSNDGNINSNGSSGSNAIEHLFQQKVGQEQDLETVIGKHVQKATEGLGTLGISDPFQVVHTASGEHNPCKA